MPCRDEWTEREDLEKDYRELALVRASLCAVLSVLEEDDATFAAILKKIDWKEAGVSKREFLSWWTDHMEKDRKRKEQEAKLMREKEILKEALSKLTDEEKKILGIK